MKNLLGTAAVAAILLGGAAKAGHVGVSAEDQEMSAGTVTASEVKAEANGWLVVHRTADGSKPGSVVGHAPLRAGTNTDVTAILTEPVAPGDMLMLMLHAEDGGTETGVFEYSLGAKEDGPVKADGKLIMAVVTAQ